MLTAAAAVGLAALAVASPPAPRERPLVVMLLPPMPSKAVTEGAIRLNGELVGAGFDVQSTDRLLVEEPERDRLEEAARELDASIVVALFDDPSGRSIDVWVVDRLTGKAVIRHVGTGAADSHGDEAKLVAIRTAELLRASLLELLVASPEPRPQRPAPAPPRVISWVAKEVDPGRGRRWHPALSAGGAVLVLPRIGVAPAADLALGVTLDDRWSLQAVLVGLGPALHTGTMQGAADLRQTVVTLQAGVRLGDAALRPTLSVGAGAYRVGVDGRGDWPYEGLHPATTAFCVTAGAGAALRLPWRMELALEAQALLAHPYAKVTVGGEEAGTAGRPTIITSLVLTGLP